MPEDIAHPTLEKPLPPSSPQGGQIRLRLMSLLAALLAGLIGALLSVTCMLTLRLAAGIPTPVELFGDFVLKKLPVDTFVNMEVHFSPNSKTAPLGLALLGMIAVGMLLGLPYALLTGLRPPIRGLSLSRREWLLTLLLGVFLSGIGAIVFWAELHQNFLGLPLSWAALVSALGLLLDFEVYSLTLGWCYRALTPKQQAEGTEKTVQERRTLLARSSVAVLGVGAAGGVFGLVHDFLNNYASYDGKQSPPPTVTSPITPNNEHYVVTQNPIDPAPDRNFWRLEMMGMLGTSGSYTYDEFTSLPSISRAITLECIANYIGGHLLSTAIWQGVTFRSLLEKHGGAQAQARYVAFYSIDGYTVSQPLDEVLKTETLLAFRMNGSELPIQHGYPVRVLIPGHYGEENPKWLTRIELTDHFVGGLYSDQGWYNGQLHTITRIDRPHGQLSFTKTVEIGGLAFAGNRGIQRVELSTDGGSTWQDGQLAPPLSEDSWVLWTYQWQPVARGQYTLVARATDGTGQRQTSLKQGTIPNGATGYHKVTVTLV